MPFSGEAPGDLPPKAGKLQLGSPTSLSSSITKPPKRIQGVPSKFRLAWYLSLVVVFSFISPFRPQFIYALTPIQKNHKSPQSSSRLEFGMSSSDLKNEKNNP